MIAPDDRVVRGQKFQAGDIGLSVFNLYNRTNTWYRQFDLSETPVLINDMNFLGITPAISVRFEF